MSKSAVVLRKKRGRPATGRDPVTAIRLSGELRATLDAWILAQPEPRPTRSEAIRQCVEGAITPKATRTPAPTLSELLRKFVEADPTQLERGETTEEWVASMYLSKNSVAKLKRVAVELLGQFDGEPNPAAVQICAMLRPLTE